jgi:hypothetical protein
MTSLENDTGTVKEKRVNFLTLNKAEKHVGKDEAHRNVGATFALRDGVCKTRDALEAYVPVQ